MLTISWDKTLEAENRREAERILNPYLWLVPGWVDHLKIWLVTTDNPNSMAASKVMEQYREVSISLRPLWFTSDEAAKREAMVHELIHIHTNPLYDFALNAIRQYSDGVAEGTRQIVFDEMECYLERSTCDLANVIVKNAR